MNEGVDIRLNKMWEKNYICERDVYVCVCVCVCERERERGRYVCVCVRERCMCERDARERYGRCEKDVREMCV